MPPPPETPWYFYHTHTLSHLLVFTIFFSHFFSFVALLLLLHLFLFPHQMLLVHTQWNEMITHQMVSIVKKHTKNRTEHEWCYETHHQTKNNRTETRKLSVRVNIRYAWIHRKNALEMCKIIGKNAQKITQSQKTPKVNGLHAILIDFIRLLTWCHLP